MSVENDSLLEPQVDIRGTAVFYTSALSLFSFAVDTVSFKKACLLHGMMVE